MAVMKAMTRHAAGTVYLLALVLGTIGFIVLLAFGITDAPEEGEPIVLLGWMTMPLAIGVFFVLFWLIAYMIYFFFFWPYR